MKRADRRAKHRDRRIAKLLAPPPGETVQEQKARCEEWARRALRRLSLSSTSAYQSAIAQERKPYWWRDQSFLMDGPRRKPRFSPCP